MDQDEKKEKRKNEKEKHMAVMSVIVQELRSRLGLTQSQFAQLVQVKTNTIASWEQKRSAPGDDSTKAIKDIEEMTNDEEFVQVVQESLKKPDGLESVAVLIGMILGLTKVTKLRYDVAKKMLYPGSTYLEALDAYLHRADKYR